MTKKKYYVVWKGYDPGIYESWSEAQLQIKGYPGAEYKSFKSRTDAEEAFSTGSSIQYGKKSSGKKKPTLSIEFNKAIIRDSISVDAACAGNPGLMEYQGVETFSGSQLFHVGPMEDGTNNIGEFLALVHALARFQKMKNEHTSIYTDSRTGMAWVRKMKVKTTLKQTPRNQQIFDLISRAEKWLKSNTHRNPIVKWNTEEWGEIPADFGRK